MVKYTLVRTVWIFIVLAIILSMNFILLKVAPAYPPTTENDRNVYFARQVSDGYMTVRVENDPVEVLKIRNQEVELDPDSWYKWEPQYNQYRIYEPIPIAVQYVRWVKNIVMHWNWGLSTRVSVNVPVFDVIKLRIPITMKLNLLSLFFYIPIGFAFGIIAALKKNSVVDNVISTGVMIFISVPSFVTMTFFLMLFGYGLEWLPTQFLSSDITGWGQLTTLLLPIFGLSVGSIAGLTRVTRAELTEVLTSEFLLLARTKGLTRQQAVIRHAMRNSMVPLVPGIIGSFIGLLSGSVIIEQIYGIPGTGTIFLRAMEQNNYDYNLILGVTAFYTIISLFAVLMVDLSYGIVDPRIRMGAKK